MTAIDKLKRLLDKRGVKWWDRKHGDPVVFKVGEVKWFADDGVRDGMVELSTILITPEQAIVAALGSGECKNIAPDYLDFLCSACGFVHYHSDENDTGDGNDWAHCPRCGKAVKR